MADVSNIIRDSLLSFKDDNYKKFHSKLMPTVNPDSVIGIQVPVIRKFARKLINQVGFKEIYIFMNDLPHKYYEENNLHAFFIEEIEDFNSCIAALNDFLPFVDNWATCDYLSPKCFLANKDLLLKEIKIWLKSNKTYTIRFGIKSLMNFYLDKDFKNEYLDLISSVKSDEYYVNMMRAWFFATALAKQYNSTLPYITENRLDIWTHNRTIQKSVESKRLSIKQKEELKKYKLKL